MESFKRSIKKVEQGPVSQESSATELESLSTAQIATTERVEQSLGLNAEQTLEAHQQQRYFEKLDRFEFRTRHLLRRMRGALPGAPPVSRRAFEAPIEEGEVFDVNEGLALIRYAPRDSRPEHIAEFKEKLAHQKEGIATVQAELITMLRNSPDTPLSSLESWFNQAGSRYGLTEEQRSYGRSILLRAVERREHIRALRERCKDDTRLYQALFNANPQGDVSIRDGAVTLYIQCRDPRDYARIYHQKYDSGDITEEDTQLANKSGGVSIGSARLTELEGAIIAENTNLIEGNPLLSADARARRSEEVRVHEEQHAIKRFFATVQMRNSTLEQLYTAQTKEDDIRILESHARFRREVVAEDRAKDEILAYFKDGTPAAGIYGLLTQSGGLYDYLKNGKRNFIREIARNMDDEELEPLAGEVAERVFKEEYNWVLARGCAVPFILQANGYNTEQVISLLMHEPLSKWEKVGKRLLGNRMPALKE